MRLVLATTTIHSFENTAIKKFLELGLKVVVAGDLKTPHSEYLEAEKVYPNLFYLTPEYQNDLDIELSTLIGWNCIQRRNMAMLFAFKLGAEFIGLIDDDNFPYSNWELKMNPDNLTVNQYAVSMSYVANPLDPVVVKNSHNLFLWHRGFPVGNFSDLPFLENEDVKITQPFIVAGLWNGTPDLDVIGHLSYESYYPIEFRNVFPYMFINCFVPFNSQNTVIPREFLKNYFLFPHIGRMDDIWASYYLESAYQFNVKIVFIEPTVYQQRNQHFYEVDFRNEMLGFSKTMFLLRDLMRSPDKIHDYIPKKSSLAFDRWKELVS